MSKKGFTLIELIVVIIIIAILVLIATPKFLNYIEEAKLTRIIHDIKVSENMVTVEYIKQGKLPDDFKFLEDESIIEAIEDELLYDKAGKVKVNIRERETGNNIYYRLSDRFIAENFKTKLRGIFLIDENLSGRYLDKYIPEADEEEEQEKRQHIVEGKYEVDLYESISMEIFHDRHDIDKNLDDYLEENSLKMRSNDLYDLDGSIGKFNFGFNDEEEKMYQKLYKNPSLYMDYEVKFLNKYDKDSSPEDYDKDYQAVILGYKNKDDGKNSDDIIIPPYLDCSCGNKHKVVAIGDRYGELDEMWQMSEDGVLENRVGSFVFGRSEINDSVESEFLNSIELVEIPETVEYIGLEAFKNLGIKKLKIADNSKLKIIGPSAFFDMKDQVINIPKSVELISSQAFRKFNNNNIYTKVNGLEDSPNLKVISNHAFEGANVYTEGVVNKPYILKLKFSDSIEYIGKLAFAAYNQNVFIDEIKLPENDKYQEINEGSFQGMLKASELIIPKNVDRIERNAFNISTGGWQTEGESFFHTAKKLKILNPKIKYISGGFLFNSYDSFFDEVSKKFNTTSGNYIRSYDREKKEWTYDYISLYGENVFSKKYLKLD